MTSDGPEKIDVEALEKRFGVIDKRDAECADHGPYLAMLFRNADDWSDCPTCADERREREEAERRVQEAQRAEARRLELLLGHAAIPPRFAGASFDAYRADPGNKRQKHNLDLCRAYAEDFPARHAGGEGLLLMGLQGTGKTHLAVAIGLHVINVHRQPVVYTLATRMFRRLKETFDRNSRETEAQVIRAYASVALLILDEIGLGHCSPTELGHLFEVINERYENKRPTIVITNIDNAADLEEWIGSRTMDRLRDGGKALLFDWPSYRASKSSASIARSN